MPEAFVITFVAIALLVWLILRRSGDVPVDSFYDPSDGDRQPHKWGYTDTIFEFDGPRSFPDGKRALDSRIVGCVRQPIVSTLGGDGCSNVGPVL